MRTTISKMQPIGDAAGELRAVFPGINQATAVHILRTADGSTWNGNDGSVVQSRRDEIYWDVITPSARSHEQLPYGGWTDEIPMTSIPLDRI
jgi:hypothetical protein